MMKTNMPLVSICSITYNHAPYIRQCLEGFLMQKTDFPIEIIINDDASTDGTTDIIKEYKAKHHDIIKPIYHEENLYSKGVRGMLRNFCFPLAKGKYIALCEGDDYWIDPLKLQKQVDFMEANPDYTMCCTNAVIQTVEGNEEWCRYPADQTVPTEDVITHGGLFVQTATLLFRREVLIEATDYPESAKKCHVGDFPLQIYAALKGKVYWFVEKTAVYRFCIQGAWTSTNNKKVIEEKISGWRSEIDMLKDMDRISCYKFTDAFKRRQREYVCSIIVGNPTHCRLITKNFEDVCAMFDFRHHAKLLIVRLNLVCVFNFIIIIGKYRRLLIKKLKSIWGCSCN